MKKFKASRKRIANVCTLERSVKGKVYKKGTCYIQVSAVSQEKDNWGYLYEDSEVTAGKYMMLISDNERDGYYVYTCLDKCMHKFMSRYVTTMNIQREAFDHLMIPWIDDDSERDKYVKLMRMHQMCIDDEDKVIKSFKMFKKVMMSLMFPS